MEALNLTLLEDLVKVSGVRFQVSACFAAIHSYETTKFLTANRRISNIEPQNVEVWNRCAQSFLVQSDRIPILRHSITSVSSISVIRFFKVSFIDQTGRSAASRPRSCETFDTPDTFIIRFFRVFFRFDWLLRLLDTRPTPETFQT